MTVNAARLRHHRWRQCFGALVVVLASGADASSQTAMPFWQDQARGYWFYEEPPEEPEEEIAEELQPPPPPAPPPPPENEFQEMEVEAAGAAGPVPGSTAWIREALPKLLEAAMDDPSPDNVERYFLVQQLALNRATEFSEMARFVTVGHPILDESQRRPEGTSMAMDQAYAARIRLERTLDRLSDRIGLWFFFDGECVSCPTTAKNLERMQDEHGFEVRAISMDGTPLFGDAKLDVLQDTGQAEALRVREGGTIVLVEPPDYATILSHGVLSLVEIQDRIVAIAYRQGIITDEEYAVTRAVKPIPEPLAAGPIPVSADVEDLIVQADDLLRERRINMNNIFPGGRRR